MLLALFITVLLLVKSEADPKVMHEDGKIAPGYAVQNQK